MAKKKQSSSSSKPKSSSNRKRKSASKSDKTPAIVNASVVSNIGSREGAGRVERVSRR